MALCSLSQESCKNCAESLLRRSLCAFSPSFQSRPRRLHLHKQLTTRSQRTLELLRADASSLTFIQLLGSDMLAETLLFLRYTIYVHLGEICGMSTPTTPELCLFRPSDVPHGLWPELHDPHLALAFAARLLDHELDKPHLKPYPLDNDIYVQLCHHLLVFYTLLYRNARQSEKEEGTNSPSVAGAAARTLEELARLAKAQGDPRAEAVVAAIQPALQLAKLTGATWLFCSSGGPLAS